MLLRITHASNLVTYQSPLLRQAGVVHAFSTRLGGVSAGLWRSLNLGQSCGGFNGSQPGDDPALIEENYRRLQQGIGGAALRRVWVQQVHGAAVYDLDGAAQPADPPPQADALVTGVSGWLLTIRIADCVPVLLAERSGKVVAAVHAGWRSLVAGVIPATLRIFAQRYAAPPHSLVAAIGPCISGEHFEVGPEVAREFTQLDLAQAIQSRPGVKPHIDLRLAVEWQLRRYGLAQEAIDGTDRCTYRDAEEFYSHRRDHGQTGRMAAVIAVSG